MNFDFETEDAPPIRLTQALSAIELAQLIRRLEETQSAYLFKHAMVQDTAYSSLMRHDRRRLHQLVAEALQARSPDVDGELAAVLGQHFREAGDAEHALYYFQKAGDAGAARFENPEALNFYTLALQAAQELDSPARAALSRVRGLVFERIGEFEQARADLETAHAQANRQSDGMLEWQCLLDLGFLWSARNYRRAGEYIEKALDLARERNDPVLIAHSENRMGNWHLNNQDTERALEYHHLALETFQALGDTRGIAETQDLLGLTESLGGDMLAGREHYMRALEQFALLQDPMGELASRITLEIQSVNLQSDTMVVVQPSGSVEEDLQSLLQRSRELGWRAGESFHLWVSGQRFAALGDYGQSLELLDRAIAIAREIDHRQWLTAGIMLRGAVLTNLFDYQAAAPLLETALEMAKEISSALWTWTGAGYLAMNLIGQQQLEQAAEVLDRVAADPSPTRSLGQRQLAAARVELLLAQRQPERALDRLNSLLRNSANLTSETVIPRLWQLRASAYAQLNANTEAILLLEAALGASQALGIKSRVWQIQRDLAPLYLRQGEPAQADQAVAAARAVIEELAGTLNDAPLRERFRQAALQEMSLP